MVFEIESSRAVACLLNSLELKGVAVKANLGGLNVLGADNNVKELPLNCVNFKFSDCFGSNDKHYVSYLGRRDHKLLGILLE